MPKPTKKKTAVARKVAPKPKRNAKPKGKPSPTKKKAAAPARKPATKPKRNAKPKGKPSPTKKKAAAPARKPAAKPKPARAKPAPTDANMDGHPAYARLVEKLRPGRHAGGTLLVTAPGALDEIMSPWLMGRVEGRRSMGRTAFGDIVIFRDLRDRARELGLPGAEEACDVAMVDIHYKRMTVLGESADAFLASLDDPEWQRAFLRLEMYLEAKERLGDYGDEECFYFVPALALGGADDAGSVDRGNWRVHQEILLQT